MPARIEIKEDQCESCQIFTDGVEEHYIEEYREHRICSWCENQWRRKEERVGRLITFDEFVKGKLK